VPAYPVALRDKLYALFSSAKSPAAFEKKAKAIKPRSDVERAFLQDRLPRYVASLKETKPAETYESELILAESLFNHGLFFDAHEFLETTWKREPEPRKTKVQGLIQIAAAFHKLELDPRGTEGALYLLGRGVAKVADEALAEALRPALAELQRGHIANAPPVEFRP
jgi:hypothetical protein